MRKELIISFFLSLLDWVKSLKLLQDLRSFPSSIKNAFSTASNRQYAFKTSVAVVVSYGAGLCISTDYAHWAPISAVLVMQVNVAASIESSVDRVVGTLYGAILGLALYYILPTGRLSFTIGLWIIASICALLLIVNARYRLAGITSISIFTLAGHQLFPLSFALMFMLLILVSIVVSVLVSVFLWPVSGSDELDATMRKQYILAADYLEAITHAFLDKQNTLHLSYIDELHDAISKNRVVYKKIREYEGVSLSKLHPEIQTLVGGLERVRVYLSTMLEALNGINSPINEIPMVEELMALSSSSASGLRWLASHSENQPMPEVRFYIEAVTIGVSDLLDDKTFRKLSHSQLIQVLTFYNAMNHLAEAIVTLEEQVYLMGSTSCTLQQNNN